MIVFLSGMATGILLAGSVGTLAIFLSSRYQDRADALDDADRATWAEIAGTEPGPGWRKLPSQRSDPDRRL